MATMRKAAHASKPAKIMNITNNVLNMSVTVGLLGTNVIKSDIEKLEHVLREHCMVGVVALERGDTENRLHFQMVCTTRCKSALSFGIIVRKYIRVAMVKRIWIQRGEWCVRSSQISSSTLFVEWWGIVLRIPARSTSNVRCTTFPTMT